MLFRGEWFHPEEQELPAVEYGMRAWLEKFCKNRRIMWKCENVEIWK
jgi:hypothetical protein